MAIKLNTVFKTLTVPEAYVRVVAVAPDVRIATTKITYELWASKAHRDTKGATPLETCNATVKYEAETGNIMEWAYSKLKATTAFAAAVDVIEVPPTPEEAEAARIALMRSLNLYNEDGVIPGDDIDA